MAVTESSRARTRRRAFALARGLALAGTGLALWSLFRGVPYSADVFEFTVPNTAFLREQLLRGKLPLWNPYVLGGHPFLAEFQTQALYPLSLLWLAVGPFEGLGPFLWLHLMIGAWGAFEWARRLRLRPQACAVAALAFGLSPLLVQHYQHPNLLCALAWAPWVWWAALGLADRPGPRRAAALGALWALSLLGGAPEYSLFAGLGAAWALRRQVGWGAAACGVGTLACGAALVPFVELLRLSERSSGESLAEICKAQLYVTELVDLVAPFTAYADDQHSFYFAQHFMGMVPCLLALAAPRRRRWAFLGLLGGLCVLALGSHTPLYPFLFKVLPPIRLMRSPVKYAGMAAAVLVGAAAYGVHRGWARGGRAARVAALAGVAVWAVCWGVAGFGADSPWVSSLAWLGLFGGALAATTLLKKRQARAWAAAGVALAELGLFQVWVTQDIFAAAPPCPRAPLLQEPGRVLFDLGPDNTATEAHHTALCELGLANRNQLSHTYEVNGFVVPGPGKIRKLLREDVHGAFALFQPATLVVSEQTDRSRYPAGTVVMKRGIYTALHVGPPVRALFRGWGPPVPLEPSQADVDSLDFDLPGTAGTLRVLDTYFPGWVAQADGQVAAVLDVDGVREVHVPAGARHLHLQYDPDPLRWGLALSALGLLGLGLLATRRPSVR